LDTHALANKIAAHLSAKTVETPVFTLLGWRFYVPFFADEDILEIGRGKEHQASDGK